MKPAVAAPIRAVTHPPTNTDPYPYVRCKAEAGLAGSPLEVTVLTVYERCQQLAPQLDAAIEAEDAAQISEIWQELAVLRRSLEEGMRTAKVSTKLRAWLQVGAAGSWLPVGAAGSCTRPCTWMRKTMEICS